MKLDRFLQFFVVKERKFYPLFKNLAANAVEAADNLLGIVQECNHERQAELYKVVKAAEQRADEVAYTIYQELKTTYVTPFDRDDVNHLRSYMDTFIDFIHDSARRVVIYKPRQLNIMNVFMAKYIQEDAHILREIMDNLEGIPKKNDYLVKKCDRVQEIEHACDDLYEQIMDDVFSNEKDAIELVRLKNIVQAFEDTTDRAKDVIDVVRSIILKFA